MHLEFPYLLSQSVPYFMQGLLSGSALAHTYIFNTQNILNYLKQSIFKNDLFKNIDY